jgi:hypothetical protein
MPIPLLAIFSCGVGVPPAQKFDEKDFCKRSNEDFSTISSCPTKTALRPIENRYNIVP